MALAINGNSTGLEIRPTDSVRDLDLGKINTSVRASDQIYQALRQVILDMRLAPGSSISEAEVGEKIGASRTPVREAIQKLRDEGLVYTVPSRGNFVSKLSRQRVLEAQFIREALEVAIVRRLAQTGFTQADSDFLADNLARQKSAAENENFASFHELDDQFHQRMAHATGLMHSSSVLEREKSHLDRLRGISLRVAGHPSFLFSEHQQIFDAINAQNELLSTALIKSHCRSILDVLETLTHEHSILWS